MKRIGILGGTFDPVHIGHIALAKNAMKEYDLLEVRLMTGGIPPHKRNRKITPSCHRYRMTELAVEGIEGLVADSFELSKTDYTYSAKILGELKALHPDWQIFFIIGEDSLRDFDLWYHPEEIVKYCTLLVYPRFDKSNLCGLIEEKREQYRAEIFPISAEVIDVSSTQIRKKVREGKDIKGAVADSVYDYIMEEGLYRGDE